MDAFFENSEIFWQCALNAVF